MGLSFVVMRSLSQRAALGVAFELWAADALAEGIDSPAQLKKFVTVVKHHKGHLPSKLSARFCKTVNGLRAIFGGFFLFGVQLVTSSPLRSGRPVISSISSSASSPGSRRGRKAWSGHTA